MTFRAFSQTNLNKADYDKAFAQKLQTLKERYQIVYGDNKEEKIKEVANRVEPHRVEHVKAMVKSYFLLGVLEKNYANLKIKDVMQSKGFSELDTNTNWVSLAKMDQPIEPVNPNYFKQNEYMSEFTKWLKTQEKIDVGLASAPASTAVKAEATNKSEKVEAKEVKKEEKKEKEIWDLVLLSFDPAKKITVIKEIRAITNLGLKESKELVETLPSKILTKIKKDEAKPHMDKIEAAGGKVELQ